MGRYAYTPEQNAWLREHYPVMTNRELAAAFITEFGEDVTVSSMNSWGSNHHVTKEKEVALRAKTESNTKYTPEMLDFLREIIPGRSYRQVSDLFCERFGFTLTRAAVCGIRTKLGVKSGVNPGRYRKGHAPANKGKTWDEQGISADARKRMAKCHFRKGQDPHNAYHELLDERTDPDGMVYIYVRPRNAKWSARHWISKERFMWMQHNGRDFPEGHKCVHANRDRTDFSPDNLVAVPNDVYGIITSGCHGRAIDYYDRETLELAITHARLLMACNRVEAAPHRCGCCGETFKPYFKTQKTCRSCLDKGLHAPRKRRKESA